MSRPMDEDQIPQSMYNTINIQLTIKLVNKVATTLVNVNGILFDNLLSVF